MMIELPTNHLVVQQMAAADGLRAHQRRIPSLFVAFLVLASGLAALYFNVSNVTLTRIKKLIS